MIRSSSKVANRLSFCLGLPLIFSFASTATSSQDISLLKKVREHWKEGDFSLAKKQIRAYLEKNPQSDLQEELHLLLGDIYLKEGNFASALEEYEHLEQDPLVEKSLYNKSLCLYEEKKLESLTLLVDSLPSYSHLSPHQILSIRYLLAMSLYESEEKTPLLRQKAIDLFASFEGTNLEEESLAPLANLYLAEENKQKAAACYLALAEKKIQQAPQLTFQAALFLSENSPEKALSLFEGLITQNTPEKPQAIYNCLVLQYRLEQFQKIVLTYQTYKDNLDAPNLTQATYLMGKSLYHLGDFKQALICLHEILEENTLSGTSYKTAALLAFECAHKTQNLAIFESLQKKTSPFLERPEKEKIDFSHLTLLKQYGRQNDLIIASSDFLLAYPSSQDKESVLKMLTYAFYEEKKWQEAEKTINILLQEFPNTTTSFYRMQMNCLSKQLEESPPETLFIHRTRWIEVAQKSLQAPHLLTAEEKERTLFELTRHLFLQDRFSEALEVAEELNADGEEIQLIKTLCYLKDPQAKLLFALSAEKLLEKFPQIEQAASLHVHLFNAYLQLSTEADLATQEDLLIRAADHLYPIFLQKETPLQQENVKWLFEHYYNRAIRLEKEQNPSILSKAILLGESLTTDQLREGEKELYLYKLCELLTLSKDPTRKAEILDKWATSGTVVQTGLQKHLIFELAKTHESLGHEERAIFLYDLLIRSGSHSLMGATALLEKSKVLFSHLKDEEKTADNLVCLEILGHLKDLSIGSRLQEEPLHLEASLEYIYANVNLLENRSFKEDKEIELLKAFQEKMNSAPGYQDSVLVQNYLQFVEAEILYLQKMPLEEIKSKLVDLQKQTSLPPSLKKRVELRYEELSRD